MTQLSFSAVLVLSFLLAAFISAQSSTPDSDGYIGYSLAQNGDPESVIYATNSTRPNVSTTYPVPDVFLNASVHVGEIRYFIFPICQSSPCETASGISIEAMH